MRKLCTDFMRLQLSFVWTPSKTLEYTLAGLNKPMIFHRGRVYGGFPYRSFNANGNLYTLMEYYDPETGEGLFNKGFSSWNLLAFNMLEYFDGKEVIEEFKM